MSCLQHTWSLYLHSSCSFASMITFIAWHYSPPWYKVIPGSMTKVTRSTTKEELHHFHLVNILLVKSWHQCFIHLLACGFAWIFVGFEQIKLPMAMNPNLCHRKKCVIEPEITLHTFGINLDHGIPLDH